MQPKTALDDAMMRRLVPGKVRVTISVYDTASIPKNYRLVPGHSEILEVNNLREFRRLWRSIKHAISKKGGWRDIDRAMRGSDRLGDPDDPASDVHTLTPSPAMTTKTTTTTAPSSPQSGQS
jgi:hypothetical protein